ncbi:bifunctional DNA primase/polymerase [Fructobacillus fructosus]|uniref:bifunctional DNA primase/polymerase n=1 Tax=Fructobacillus fructosus TaxID=1631 RepID=UPI001658889B|nr:bifunctional DNA primase/polymerase [Fructobacillus fructosus]MBC9118631.1 bifunctional DNA primase/polymerase [Fructobacillus fructosus]MBD9365294.1 bifunctional DNA primase/polymerase [Leuconostoc mesenteroides]
MKQVHLQRYIEHGAFLFSALPNEKHNAEPGGFKNSFNSLSSLTQWQAEHPRYKDGNVGIDLSKSPLVVLDVDKHGTNGYLALANYMKAQGLSPDRMTKETYTELTPSGGLHAFYTWPSDKTKPVRTVGLLDGVDLLTDGGVIVAPSSIDGKDYKALEQEGKPVAIAEVPDWLKKLIEGEQVTNKPRTSKATRYSIDERLGMILDGFTTGQRNDQATSFIGWLLSYRIHPRKALELAELANSRSPEPLSYDELEKVYISVLKRENARAK